MTDQLIFCPFCGSNDISTLRGGPPLCNQCRAAGPQNVSYDWNTRVAPQPAPVGDILNPEVFRRMLDCATLATDNGQHQDPHELCNWSDDIAAERERRGESCQK
jgi:hypothetical protein